MSATFTALVLAGSRKPDDPLARACGVAHKCLVPVAGVPMLVRVVRTLAGCPSIAAIAISLDDPCLLDDLPDLGTLRDDGRCIAFATAATPSLSVLHALDELPYALPWLVATGDHPLLTSDIVEYFCEAARKSGADLTAGVTTAEVIRKAYPQARRTYLRFRDAACSGANLFALLTPSSRRAVGFWRRVERDRKRPWRMVRALGLGSLLAYLSGRLTLDTAIDRVSVIAGAKIAAIRLPFAEAAIDVDKPADLELVEAILGRSVGG